MNPGKECPTCGAPPGRACISESGERSGKIHVARAKLVENPVEKHTPLPDMRHKWKEWAPYEGLHPKPRPKDLQV